MVVVDSGKTSLAYIIAQELNVKIYVLNGTSLQKPSDIISPLTTLKEGEILFIDEVHAVSRDIFEVLYPVLEDNKINLLIGKEYNAKIINVKLPKFTLIVATTEFNKLPAAFINRFPINFIFENYSHDEIKMIIHYHLLKNNIYIDHENELFIAKHCKNNPRIAVNLLKRLLDFIMVEKPKIIDNEFLEKTLIRLNIYRFGLTMQDMQYLKILSEYQALSLESLKQVLNLPYIIILNHIEPNLLINGLLTKSQKGRCITEKGRELLKDVRL